MASPKRTVKAMAPTQARLMYMIWRSSSLSHIRNNLGVPSDFNPFQNDGCKEQERCAQDADQDFEESSVRRGHDRVKQSIEGDDNPDHVREEPPTEL